MISNHIYIQFHESVINTRKQIPAESRRSGLIVTYTNPTTKKSITEQFIGTDVSAKAELSWLVNTNWRVVEYYDPEKNATVTNIPDGSITEDKLSESLRELLTQKGGTIINYPDEDDLTIRNINNKGVLSLKDRIKNEKDFIGKGIKILRRRLIPVEGNDIISKPAYHFDGFINTSGIYEISCMYEDNSIFNTEQDDSNIGSGGNGDCNCDNELNKFYVLDEKYAKDAISADKFYIVDEKDSKQTTPYNNISKIVVASENSENANKGVLVYALNDFKIFYDVYHHKFVLRTYQLVDNKLTVVYYSKWIGKSIYTNYNYIRFYDNEIIPNPNTIFICDENGKTYYFDSEYKPVEVADGKYEDYDNLLMQSDFSDTDTIYVIKYDFKLGENIVIPTGCALRFDGGKIISTTNTIIGNGDAKLENVVGNIYDYIPFKKEKHGFADGQLLYVDEHLYMTKDNNLTLIM